MSDKYSRKQIKASQMNDRVFHTVTSAEDGQTVKELLKQMNISRRTVTRLMQSRGILLNEASVPLSETVHVGDQLCLLFAQPDLKTALFLKGDTTHVKSFGDQTIQPSLRSLFGYQTV